MSIDSVSFSDYLDHVVASLAHLVTAVKKAVESADKIELKLELELDHIMLLAAACTLLTVLQMSAPAQLFAKLIASGGSMETAPFTFTSKLLVTLSWGWWAAGCNVLNYGRLIDWRSPTNTVLILEIYGSVTGLMFCAMYPRFLQPKSTST